MRSVPRKSGLGSSNWTARSRSTSTPPTISSWCRRSCPVPSMPSELRVIALEGVPEVRTGDDLAALLNDAIARTPHATPLREDDVLVVTQKVVSKAEGAIVDLSTVRPRPEASEFARRFDRDARQVEVVLREARRVVRMEQGVLITETEHGFVCANGGVDASNVGPDSGSVVTLLPRDPDASAARIREGVRERTGVDLPVVVSDSFGRPWRWGIVDVAIGVSGLAPLDDLRGSVDHDGPPTRLRPPQSWCWARLPAGRRQSSGAQASGVAKARSGRWSCRPRTTSSASGSDSAGASDAP